MKKSDNDQTSFGISRSTALTAAVASLS